MNRLIFSQIVIAILITGSILNINVNSLPIATFDEISLYNPSKQAINLSKKEDGGLINSWYFSSKDADQKFKFISSDGKCGYINHSTSTYTISVDSLNQSKIINGTRLEAWKYTPGSWQQRFCFRPTNIIGAYKIYLESNPNYVINIPFSKNNKEIVIWEDIEDDFDQYFYVETLNLNENSNIALNDNFSYNNRLLLENKEVDPKNDTYSIQCPEGGCRTLDENNFNSGIFDSNIIIKSINYTLIAINSSISQIIRSIASL